MTSGLRSIRRALVAAVAFTRKEIVGVLGQPRLLLALVVGPFVILALFGFGYDRDTDPITAVVVVPDDAVALRDELTRQIDSMEGMIELHAITSDADFAAVAVASGEADVVLVAPDDARESVRGGEQAVFLLLHRSLDPYEQSTIRLLARSAIDDVNRDLLERTLASTQEETADVAVMLEEVLASVSSARRALEAGDLSEARAVRAESGRTLLALGAVLAAGEVVDGALGVGDGSEATAADQVGSLQERLEALDLSGDSASLAPQIAELAEIEREIEALSVDLSDFRRIPPEVLVSPLAIETRLATRVDVGFTDFYGPGVIALLLQHLAVTFAALSIVRERQLGTFELFRVGPTGTFPILTGKYAAYTMWGAAVGAALTALMVAWFGMPIQGSIVELAAVQLLLVVASLGIGFVVSAVAGSDTQAVNLAMIVLLLSVFFSGFFLTLDRFVPEVRAVAWAIPMTHALEAMRRVMLLGEEVATETWLALGGAAGGLFVLSWALLGWRIRTD